MNTIYIKQLKCKYTYKKTIFDVNRSIDPVHESLQNCITVKKLSTLVF